MQVNLDDALCFRAPQHLDNDCDLTTVAEAWIRNDRARVGKGHEI